ncbi:MAG: hypothetical protein ACRC4L_01985 [Mycoplasma sp.]
MENKEKKVENIEVKKIEKIELDMLQSVILEQVESLDLIEESIENFKTEETDKEKEVAENETVKEVEVTENKTIKEPIKKEYKKKESKKVESVVAESTDEKTKLDADSQFLIILLTILTFGLFRIYLNNKIEEAKKISEVSETSEEVPQLKTSIKIPFKVEKFVELLGGAENILSIDASLNTLKIEVKNKKIVNQDSIKKLGAKGIMTSANKLSIVLGDYALNLKLELEQNVKIDNEYQEVLNNGPETTE